MTKSTETELFDVLAVNIDSAKIRFFGQRKTKANAEAIENMAIMRRGVDEEFYVAVPTGKYKEGEIYEGV